MKIHIKGCERYLCFKTKFQREELHLIMATHSLELFHIEFLSIESSKTDKEINVLVINDHFMHYVQTIVTPSQTAKVTAQTLWDKLFINYEFPEKILSDQGHNWVNNLITELCCLLYIKKLHSTPYRTHTNGQWKRFNCTLTTMIGTLPGKAKVNWQEYVST